MAENRLLKILSRWRVRVGTMSLVPILVLAKPTPKWAAIGFAVCLLGITWRAWAAGHLRKEKELAISGPYQYTRNPLYLGNLLIGAGVVLGARSWWVLAIFVLYFLIFYPAVIQREKARMNELFREKYEAYGKFVPLFFPRLKFHPRPDDTVFSWARYKTNKEYRALTAASLFWAVMLAKMLLTK
jgi:protein-S-isoprenylcysteine O-methyltransferase Ste14